MSIFGKITFLEMTHVMSISHFVAIGVEIPRIDMRYSLEKEFTKLSL